jgi:ABC-2 type transport system ATP-binding protein
MQFQGSLQELQKFKRKDSAIQIHTSNNTEAVRLLHNYNPVTNGESFSISYEDIGQVAAINRLLVNNDVDVFLLQPKENNLEQLFIDLTLTQS